VPELDRLFAELKAEADGWAPGRLTQPALAHEQVIQTRLILRRTT